MLQLRPPVATIGGSGGLEAPPAGASLAVAPDRVAPAQRVEGEARI
jgi:hypothetical protein